jgi:hypothetical protein
MMVARFCSAQFNLNTKVALAHETAVSFPFSAQFETRTALQHRTLYAFLCASKQDVTQSRSPVEPSFSTDGRRPPCCLLITLQNLSPLKFVHSESTDGGICECCSAAKVRVTFFQAEKPLNVTSPEPNEDQAPTDPDMSATIVTTLPDGHPAFHRQER